MKADLTRNTFDPLKHFSRVLMQQGRVQLDADWNEQTGILLHLMRRFSTDLFGPAFSPAGGFTVTLLAGVNNDVAIQNGSYYLNGILCELASTIVPILAWDVKAKTITVNRWTVDEVSYQVGQYLQIADATQKVAVTGKITTLDYDNKKLTLDQDLKLLKTGTKYFAQRLITYLTQADLPNPPALPTRNNLQMYLDVWERLVTDIEDDSIREVALNGPDTAARARVVWQVKAFDTGQQKMDECMVPQALIDQLQPPNRGLLRARTQPGQASTDPCTISPDSRYRGPENQLYRVEIHTGSNVAGMPASFKWSRENGAVVFPIVALALSGNTTSVTLANLGRDDRFGLTEGDYVEVQDDASVLTNTPGPLLQVQSIDRTGLKVTLAGTTAIKGDATLHPLLRRWDHKQGDATAGGLNIGKDGAAQIPADPADWLNLEDGVQIMFDTPGDSTFRSADYWLIPARVATGDVIWRTETATDAQGKPVTNPVAMPPDGVTHAYAPLALVTIKGSTVNIGACKAVVPPVWKSWTG